MPHLADIHNCTGCMACVDSCHKEALSVVYNNEGHLTYAIVKDKCIECGICEKTCPVISNFSYGTNQIMYSTPFAAWGLNPELRKKSTSGGVFSALAYYVISNGGVAIGAALQKNNVKHIAIESVKDIWMLQGSKYTQSNTYKIYDTARCYLKKGRTVLFSGTGCQIAGLLSYIGNRHYPGNLITMDIICGGVPSRFIIDSYLKHYPNVSEISGFRNKSKYEFSVVDNKGIRRVVPLRERPFPLVGFYTELTNRYSCYDCKFNGAHRRSDITIGDYWGDIEFTEQHQYGLSIAVAHTEKGRKILKESDVELHEVDWGNFLMHNPRMIDGHKKASQSNARNNLAVAFKEYPYERLLQVYANKATWKEPLLMLQKILRYFIGRINGIIYQQQIKKRIKKLYQK